MRKSETHSRIATLLIFLLFAEITNCRKWQNSTRTINSAFKIGYPLPKRNFITETYSKRVPKIMCLVHTAAPSHATLARTVYDVWAKNCDDVLYFTNAPIDWDVPHVYYPLFSTRDHSWEKIRHILQFV